MKSDRKSRNRTTLPEVALRFPKAEETEGSEEPEDVVTRAEARAREDQKKAASRRSDKCIVSKREYADSLHRQADILHHRGDYEAALVLYHRATTAYPRDPSHAVAARRTSAAITSATNPSGILKKFLPGTKNAAELAANYCPETAALRARMLLQESPDPVSAIDQILKYFDSRKDFWREPQTPQDCRRSTLVPRSRMMLRQLSTMASAALQNLQAAFASGDANSVIGIGEELMVVSAALPDCNRYQVLARHYLSMAQISLGRHDRAVDQVSRMLSLARVSGEAVLRLRSMATLGRVHLSFGHLEAAARAWERLVPEVEDAVPKSWLLHEIGRCYFEMKRHGKALETARRCIEYADEGNSRKWFLHGKLLSGQALVELGRLGEAVEALRVTEDAAREENDQSTVEYVKDLIDRVTGLLRRDVCPDDAEIKVEGVKRNDGAWRARSKSDDTLRDGKSREWNSHGSSGGTAKSRMALEPFPRRRFPKRNRMGNARVEVQRRRKDIGRIEDSVPAIQPSRSGTFDLRMREGADLSGISIRIGGSGRNQRKIDPSSGRREDVNRESSLPLRIRAIRKASTKNKNSDRKSGDDDGNGNDPDEDQVPRSGSEKSDNTGVTFVIDESSKSSISMDRDPATSDAEGEELFRVAAEVSGTSPVVRVVDRSKGAEYFGNESSEETETSRWRARRCDEEIGEAEDEDEVGSSLSQVSPASTGKTYLVDEGEKMSPSGPQCRRDDYPVTTGNEKKYVPSFDISPEGLSLRNDDSKNAMNVARTIGSSTGDSIFGGEKKKKTVSVNDLSVRRSSGGFREKGNCSVSQTKSGFFGERCGNDTRGLCAVLEEQLTIGESISTSRSYGLVFSVGQNPPLSTSPRKRKPRSP